MKNFFLIGLLFAGYFLYSSKSVPKQTDKNKEITQVIDKHFTSRIDSLKSKPNVTDIKVLHDKKKLGIIIKSKLKSQPHHHLKLDANCTKDILIKDLGNRYELKQDLLELLQNNIYIRYNIYFSDGSMAYSFDFNEADFS